MVWNIVFRTFGLIMVCCLWNIWQTMLMTVVEKIIHSLIFLVVNCWIITLLLKTIGHRLISVSVCVTVSWRYCQCSRIRTENQNGCRSPLLRATQYHYLASYFKDVPLVTKTLTGEEANTVEKETQANILSWCVTEFKESQLICPVLKIFRIVRQDALANRLL